MVATARRLRVRTAPHPFHQLVHRLNGFAKLLAMHDRHMLVITAQVHKEGLIFLTFA
jgi:hypothetical protein